MPGRRPKREVETSIDLLSTIQQRAENEGKPETAIEDLPLNTLGDYLHYNERARAINKKLKVARHKIKQCPVELHPKQRVIITRNNGQKNPIPVFLSDERIEYKESLIPGKTYDLPLCVIDHLAERGVDNFGWVENADGSTETKKVSSDPRFSIRTIYLE